MFDFKPLEPEVCVPKLVGDKPQTEITVFPSAKGKRACVYCLKDEPKYRTDQRNSSIGYNDKVIFREEGTNQKLLAEKAIDHLNIAMATFTNFNTTIETLEIISSLSCKILEAFGQLIAIDNSISWYSFFDILREQEYWPNLEKDELSSESEVDSSEHYISPEILGSPQSLGSCSFIPV